MTDEVILDEFLLTLSVRNRWPEAQQTTAIRLLRRGGFVPALRRLVREFVRQYPELRRLNVRVRR